jgi:hypothetical protein
MLHHQERFRHRFESHEVFSLRMRLNRTPTARARSEIKAEMQSLEAIRYTRERGYPPATSPELSPVTPDQSPNIEPMSDDEHVPLTPEYGPGPNNSAERVNNPMPITLQTERARGQASSITGTTTDVNDATPARMQRLDHVDAVPAAPPSPAAVAPTNHAGIRTYWTSSRSNPANAGRLNAVPAPTPTPRSLRHSRRSAHLQLALRMCCVDEVQSSAIVLNTTLPLLPTTPSPWSRASSS